MPKVHIKKSEMIGGEHFKLKKIKFDLEKQDGTIEEQEREVYEHGNAVAALLYNPFQSTILLTKQFRLPSFMNGNPSGMLTEVCAGLIDDGEHPEETIKREILEETGYKINKVQKVYEAYTSAGASTELLYLYLAEYHKEQKVSEGGGVQDEGEHIELDEMSFHKCMDLLKNGQIRDAKTIILLQYAMLKGVLR